MNMLTLGAAGIAAVLLAVWMKGVKAEYGIFVVIAVVTSIVKLSSLNL